METEFRGLNQNIPRSLKSMPILEQWVKKHSARKPLAGVTALFIQHQLGNQVPMTRAMLELGLEKKRLFWLDVPYTSNAQVREELVRMGIPRQNLIVADDYRILMAYAPYQRKRVQELIRRFLEDPPERLLVLDDGAYFLEAASCFKDRLPSEAKDGSSRVAVVEQTTRGVDKIKSSDAMRLYAQSIPIVNVARSTPKKTLEPAFIGRAVCTALKRKLADRFPRGHSSRCLILGFGTIGSRVAHFVLESLGFKRNHIFVFDPIRCRCCLAEKEQYSLWRRGNLKTRFNLVIGCSGRASFTVDDHVYLEEDAFLASASSGSVELSREDFIELAASSTTDDIAVRPHEFDEKNIHSDIPYQLGDRNFTFLNGGFPVNFEGKVNSIPARYMQPTATMMVSASVQALSCSAKGLVNLDPYFCAWLKSKFWAELGDDAPELLDWPRCRRK